MLLLVAAMRVATFLLPLLLSTDVYRYVWDGWVQAAGTLAITRRSLPDGPAARAAHICWDALWLGAATMAVLSPYYPWYLTALALPAVLAPRPAALWLMLSAPVLYLDPDHDRVLWPSLVFLPFIALLALNLPRRPRLPLSTSQGGHPCPPL